MLKSYAYILILELSAIYLIASRVEKEKPVKWRKVTKEVRKRGLYEFEELPIDLLV